MPTIVLAVVSQETCQSVIANDQTGCLASRAVLPWQIVRIAKLSLPSEYFLPRQCSFWTMGLRKHISYKLMVIAVTLVTFMPVRAENTTTNVEFALQQENDEALDTIEVIADVAETGDVIHDEFTGSHQRIHSDELKRRDITVADILSHESGVQSRQSGGFGTFSSMSVRAATAAQTGVYLDGVLLNSAGDAVVDLSMLELLTLDSVDIYRGATPMQLGFGSIGGAINLKSATAANGDPSTVALLGIGSFGTQRVQLLNRSPRGRFDFVSAFSFQQSENDFPFLDSNGTPLNINDDVSQLRNNAQVRKTSGMFRSGMQWGSDSRSDLLLQATGRALGVPEWRNVANNEADLVSNNLRLQLTHTLDGIGLWNSRYSLYLHNDNEVFDDQLSQIGLGAQHTKSTTNTTGFQTYWEHVGALRTNSFSAEVRQESENASDLLEDNFNYRVERRTVNLSAQNTRYAMADRLLLTTSLSSQLHQDQYKRITRQDQSSRIAAIFSPSIGVRFDSSAKLNVRANIGRYYREPSFNELFRSLGLFQGNNNLDAEEGVNADIGLTWKPGTALSVESSLFASWRDELIATVFDARGVGRAINVGKARIVGIELSANWQLNEYLSFRTNLTSQDAMSLQAFDAFNKKQLPGEAKHTAYFRLQHSHKGLRAFVEADGSWDRFYDQANVLPAKNSWLQNLGVDWQHGRWTLAGALTNISDQNIEDFNGLPRPGRSFSFTITTRL